MVLAAEAKDTSVESFMEPAAAKTIHADKLFRSAVQAGTLLSVANQ